ncbi:phosphatase PAP2-related protein [Pedobacter metabolipauper]|uniref:PAP2 superfamily protein n=1 Tax=Pedobacter metabolipauper TaxID=425513 RepID=A0A4R6SZW8_9SPHI|nr:phosphatase PAP2-related protein [Pedobacter metabolipauper]TDQ11625.1 PAP2 superfamily protein [Pedobacter metabolipauper]
MHSKQFSWSLAWDYPAFRIKLVLGLIILVAILLFIPQFFNHIQDREGHVLNDKLLASIPPTDVSLYIFLVLYSMVALFLVRMSGNTFICLTAVWSFVFLCIARIITITLVPLNPPLNMVELADPCSILFYRSNIITKDLFFSGHTATLIVGGLCMKKKTDRVIVFAAALIIGCLLLVQHVHYTVDVLMAPFFSVICWYLGRIVAKTDT